MKIQTVFGPVKPEELGVTLIHEHVVCDFGGAEVANQPGRCNPDDVVDAMRPYLEALKEAGGQSMVDCSPRFLGRNVGILRRLSEQTGIRIITNTGFYKEPSLPRAAIEGSADYVASMWIREAQEGIEDSGIRPGIIKIAVEEGPLSEVHEKIVRAAARAHLATGLTIVSHTGDGTAGLQQLDVLADEGVAASAFIWAHADTHDPSEPRLEAAKRGAWLELDAIGYWDYSRQIGMLHELLGAGYEKQLLISQDAGWYTVGEPGGGEPRPYDKLLTEFLPALERSGISEETCRRLVTANPQRALTPIVRRA